MVRKGLGYLITVQGVSELWKEDEIVGRFLDPPIICRSVFTWKREQPFSLDATKFIDHIRENFTIREKSCYTITEKKVCANRNGVKGPWPELPIRFASQGRKNTKER